MPPKRWSLSYELHTLEAAVDAARILIGAVATQQLGTDADDRLAPYAAEAVLVLVTLRTREIGRMLRGETPAETLCAMHNKMIGNRDEHDVVFHAKRVKRAKTNP